MRVQEDDPDRAWEDPGVFRVSDGVYRIPLPIRNDHLGAVNVYAIVEGETLTLVDSGVAVPEAHSQLEAALGVLDCGLQDVTRFLVTHVHYDHYSQAIATREKYGTRVALGRDEELSLSIMADPTVESLAQRLLALRRYGASDVADEIERRERRTSSAPARLPDEWLDDSQELSIGSRTLKVVHTPGHTLGHVIFVDASARLTFSGDHVLPHITPSIGFEAAPNALPLQAYLNSLARVRDLPDTTLLPGHGWVTQSIHARVDELGEHHSNRLRLAFECVDVAGVEAANVARELRWTRRNHKLDDLDSFNQMLAILETGAHLDLLVSQGQIGSTESVDGTLNYFLD